MMIAARIQEMITMIAVIAGPVCTFDTFERSGDSVLSSQRARIQKFL